MRSRNVIAPLMALVLILSGSPYLAATLLFSHGHHHVLSQIYGATTTLVFHHHEVEDMHGEQRVPYKRVDLRTFETWLLPAHASSTERDVRLSHSEDHIVELPDQSVDLPSQQLKPSPRMEVVLSSPVLNNFHVPVIPNLLLKTSSRSSSSRIPRQPEQFLSIILLI